MAPRSRTLAFLDPRPITRQARVRPTVFRGGCDEAIQPGSSRREGSARPHGMGHLSRGGVSAQALARLDNTCPKPLVLVLTGATYFETGTHGAGGQVHGVLPNPLALAGRTSKRRRPCIPRLTTGALLAHFRYAAGTTRGTAWRSG